MKVTELQLADMEEQASLLAELLKVIKYLSFDNCYTNEDAINDLWKVTENYVLDFRKHLPD